MYNTEMLRVPTSIVGAPPHRALPPSNKIRLATYSHFMSKMPYALPLNINVNKASTDSHKTTAEIVSYSERMMAILPSGKPTPIQASFSGCPNLCSTVP
jgi:hypothetical protein